MKTTNGGSSWSNITLPTLPSRLKLNCTDFFTATQGWLSLTDADYNNYFYRTVDGGGSWTLINDIQATPFACGQMKFISASVGYSIDGASVYKTLNGGVLWEPLQRDDNFLSLNYYYSDFQCLSANQLWAGGGHGFLEISTNGGGTPLPKAYFKVDTTGTSATNNVNLLNFSKTGYTYNWLLNGSQLSTAYNSSYTHNTNRLWDTVTLIVSNGINNDTLVKYQNFYPPITVTSFTPTSGATGTVVTINGTNFGSTKVVNFGGVAASSFSILSSNTITAIVGTGASGDVKVASTVGQGSLPGFTFIPKPTIGSFTPLSAAAGSTVIINGTDFSGATAVSFGGTQAISFTIISATSISAIVPSGNSGPITVVTPGGTASIIGFISLPVITSFTPQKGTQGTLLNITGTSLSDITTVAVGGINVLSFTINSANSVTAIVGTGGTGSVTVSKTGGTFSLPGFTWFPSPIITSFFPATGAVGTVVTITGSNFNPVPANNIVYFGAVKATVTGGTNSSLIVTVPVGATFDPISVNSNNLLGYSAQPFLVTFLNGGSITATSFSRVFFSTGTDSRPTNISLGDFDGDGKTDLIVTNYASLGTNTGVWVYRNTSTSTTASFDSPIKVNNISHTASAVGDLDGDGKLDFVEANENTISTYRNTSVPGSISFVAGVVLAARSSPLGINISDVDGDGKADIITSNYADAYTSIYRNTSEPGTFSFATKVDYAVTGGKNILAVDLDGDNKPELVVPGYSSSGTISVLKNNCTKGNISFVNAVNIGTYDFVYIAAGDIDGDGKADLVTSNNIPSTISVFRNTSTLGTISFAQSLEFSAVSTPVGIAISDMDGDGKLDIAVSLSSNNLSVFKNTSTTGNISFAPKINYLPVTSSGMQMVAIGDINGDGKNDAIVTSEFEHTISIYSSSVKPEPFVQSFTPTSGGAGTSVTITGNNFTGVTAVSFGGVAATSFIVNSPTSIAAIVGAGASGDVAVTNNAGTGSLPGYVYGTTPIITSFSPISGTVGTSVTILGSNFNPVPTNNIVYFGGIKASVTAATATSLSVTVPFSSMFAPITVTTGNLTAYSIIPFVTTFAGAGSSFTANSFAQRFDRINSGASSIGDIDGDGKLDLVGIGGTNYNSFFVAKNTSTTSNLSFGQNLNFATTAVGGKTFSADIDGDGKPDVIMITSSTSISIFKNTTVNGTVSFAAQIDYLTGFSLASPSDVVINDFDGDGKPDIAVSNYQSSTLSIFKNKSTTGTISFATRVDYALPQYGTQLIVADIDGDGKPDLVTTATGTQSFSLFRNTSLPGTIAFAPRVDYGTVAGSVAVGDMDNDGKTDVAVLTLAGVSVYKNLSLAGAFSFAAKVDFPATNSGTIQRIACNDLDGDGKIDLFVALYTTGNSTNVNAVTVYKNNSTLGNISFARGIDYETAIYPYASTSGDMDGDGKPDIIVFQNNGLTGIFRNQVGGNGPSILSFLPTSAIAADSVTITGSNFTGTTAVSFGGTPAASFIVVSDTKIIAVVGNGASGAVAVTSARGIGSLVGFIYSAAPTIVSVSPLSATPGTVITITGSNFTGTTAVSFGGTAAASFTVNSSTSITVTVGAGTFGNITVTTPTGVATYTGFSLLLMPTITSFTPTSNGNSSTVTITGTNFNGTTAVNFGGTPAGSFVVVSPTTITAVVNNGSTGDVEVVTPGGKASLGVFNYLSTPSIYSFFPTSATTGTSVLINGFNLRLATAVSFGGVPATSFTITSSTTITAVVGAGASGNVALSSNLGSPALAGFTYIPISTPVVTSFLPAMATTDNTVTITGMNFTGVTAVSFGGVAASSFIIVSSTTITAVVGAGASGNVSVTTVGGVATLQGFFYSSAPFISSFSPVSGTQGSSVTISGAGFSSIAAQNIVYFGGTKAVVTAATASSLVVAVPAGATYKPISVTVANLTAYSNKAFLPTFAAQGRLDANSFAARLDSNSKNSPTSIALADIDGDGKLDFGIANNGNSGGNLSFYKNNSSAGILSFNPRLIVASNHGPNSNVFTDFNGDGSLDLLTGNRTDYFAASVYQNTSSVGTISFNPEIALIGSLGLFKAVGGDFDGDGKPDAAFLGGYSGAVTIYRNTSSAGNISFGTRQDVSAASRYVLDIAVEDVDLDGKLDIVYCDLTSVYVLKNTSSIGNISFVQQIKIELTSGIQNIAIGDLDGDGKADLAVTNYYTNMLSIVKNTSTPGYISFIGKTDYSTGANPAGVAIGDVDGNGKPDIVVANSNENSVSIFANKSANGTILFDIKYDYPTNSPPNSVSIGDIDGDGRPDIVLSNPVSNSISILTNQVTTGKVTITACANGDTTISAGITGTTYQWQQNTGAGFTNISDNSNFVGTNTANLKLIKVPAIWSGYQYKCIVDSKSTSEFTLTISPSVSPTVIIATTATNICAGDTVTFIASPTNGGVSPTYQWQVNGVNVGTNNLKFTTNSLTNGSQIKVILISTALCAAQATVASNVITISTNNAVAPTVAIATTATNSCVGDTITFNATSTNGSASLKYQWQINGVNAGINASKFSTTQLANGDLVKVLMTTTSACGLPITVISNIDTVVINSSLSPTVTIKAFSTNICLGSSISFTATTTNAGSAPVFQWQVNGVNVGTNSATFTSASLTNGSQVAVIVTSSAACSLTPSATSNTLVIAVANTPSPTVSITSPTATICTGDSLTFTATPTNAGNSPSYQWQVNGTNVGTNSSIFTTSSLTNNSQVAVLMTSSIACALSAISSNIIAVAINNGALAPTVTISTPLTKTCVGSNITFMAIPTNGGSSPTFQWLVNGVNAGINSNTFTTNNLKSNDSVQVKLISNAKCIATTNAISNIITVSMYEPTIPTILILGVISDIGSKATLSARATNAGTNPIFQWQDSTLTHGWQNIIGATAQTIIYTNAVLGNSARCILTTNLDCPSVNKIISNIIVFTANGLESRVNYYPNPVTSVLVVDKLVLSDNWQTLTINSVSGMQNLLTKNIVGQTKISVDVNELAGGMYIVTLINKQGETVRFRFIKL